MLFVVLATYQGAMENGFHLDDFNNFVELEALHLGVLAPDAIAKALAKAELPGRVVPNTLLIIDWWRGSGDPRPFQQTNLAIHALCAMAVFAFVLQALRLTASQRDDPSRDVALATAAATLWAVHPIQLQAVTYVVQRMASLVALFYLLCVIAYVAARTTRSTIRRMLWVGISIVSGGCAYLSKENSFVLPAALIVAEYGLCRRGQPIFRYFFDRYVWLLVALVTGYVLLDFFVIEGPLRAIHGRAYIHRDFTMGQRLLTQPRVLFFHLGQILWPLPNRFSLEHDFSTSTGLMTPPTTLPAIVGVGMWTIAGLACLFGRRQRGIGYLLLFPLVALVPESTFHGLEMVFEHRMYLPSVALFALAALSVRDLLRRRPGWRRPAAALTLAAITLSAWSTSSRLPAWKDDVALGDANVRVAPGAPRAWLNYALALQAAGRSGEAGDALLRAAETGWSKRLILDRIAPAMSRLEMRGDAIRVLEHLRALNGNIPIPRQQILLGELQLACGRPADARAAWESALAIAPWMTGLRDRIAEIDDGAPSLPADGCSLRDHAAKVGK